MKEHDDAFISYAHLDNAPLVEGRKGWVANLHRALEVRVAQLLGKSPHIWRDPQLKGDDRFADRIIERIANVSAFVAVVTPRYLRSEWTMRELNEFCAAAERHGGLRVHDKARVFKVLKTPVPLGRTPAQLQSLLGYEFFKVDPETGKVRELDEIFGPDAHRDFWIKLDDLAHDLCALLEEATEADQPTPGSVDGDRLVAAAEETPAAQEAVFLAVTTSDLKEQREVLQRELQQHGYTVLPDRVLPLVADEARAMIDEDLARCRMSIQMIGKLYGIVPEGGVQSFIELQHEVVSERAQTGNFPRLLWIPIGLEADDERQQHVLEQVRSDERIDDDADLLETFFEDLRTVVQDWLKRDRTPRVAEPEPAAEADTPPSLYLISDQRDVSRILPWADTLFEQRLEVLHPLFDGDEAEIREYHQENLTTCDGVLIFYGAGNELWMRRKLRELQKSAGYGRTKPPPVVGVCLIPPRTPVKERFRTHEAMVMAQWDGCAPEHLEPFIAKLKAGSSV